MYASLCKQPLSHKIHRNTKIPLWLTFEGCIWHNSASQWSPIEANKMYFLQQLTLLSFQRLQCNANPLQLIHPWAFKGVLALKLIAIDSPQLQQLPPLQDIAHSLTSLFIVSVDLEQTKNQQYLSDCRMLKRVSMPFSALETISLGLHHIAKTLEYLRLKHNVIKSIASMEGIAFRKLHALDLRHNNITHLNPECLITPQLRQLDLEYNHLVSLGDVTQYSWGNSLPYGVFLNIILNGNPWNCDGSLTWLQSGLFNLRQGSRWELIYAKPPLKACIRNVGHLICQSPDRRLGTALVPRERIVVHGRAKTLETLAGKISRCDTEFLSLQ